MLIKGIKNIIIGNNVAAISWYTEELYQEAFEGLTDFIVSNNNETLELGLRFPENLLNTSEQVVGKYIELGPYVFINTSGEFQVLTGTDKQRCFKGYEWPQFMEFLEKIYIEKPEILEPLYNKFHSNRAEISNF